MAAGIFVGTEPQLSGWVPISVADRRRTSAEVEKTESEEASREISSRQWTPEDEAYDHLVVKFSRESTCRARRSWVVGCVGRQEFSSEMGFDAVV
jgi:hypothetical protein